VARASFRAFFLGLSLALALSAQAPKTPAPTAPEEQEPPEEDAALKPEEFAFNPLQAAKELDVGNQYMKKEKYSAAANRFRRATLYDPGSPEAFVRLGEAEEKLHNFDLARQAYGKYFELAKTAKDGDAIKKRMAKWPPPAK
jgi:tetratricopeptide (TPR) repeat protein